MNKLLLLIFSIFLVESGKTQTILPKPIPKDSTLKNRASYWLTEEKNPFHFIIPRFDAQNPSKMYYIRESNNYNDGILYSYDLTSSKTDSIIPLPIQRPASINRKNSLIAQSVRGFIRINLSKNNTYSIDTLKYGRVTWVGDSLFAYIDVNFQKNGQKGRPILKIGNENGALLDTFYNFLPHYTGINGNANGLIAYSHRISTMDKQELYAFRWVKAFVYHPSTKY